MLRIDLTPYGLHIVCSGVLSAEEITAVHTDLTLPINPKCLLDITGLEILSSDTKAALCELLLQVSSNGFQRLCVIHTNEISRLQISNIIHRVFPKATKLFMNSGKTTNYKRVSREWLVYGKVSV